MLFLYNLTFTSVEWLAITGLAQCLLILVYMISRVKHWHQASLSIAYFFFLGCLFSMQVSLRLIDFYDYIRLSIWFLWAIGIPLSYLLILQVSKIASFPDKKEFLTLLLPFISGLIVYVLRQNTDMCEVGVEYCSDFYRSLYIVGSISGGLVLLLLLGHKSVLTEILKSKAGKEKYWLIISIVLANTYSIGVNILYASDYLNIMETDLLRVSIALVFVYLATTILFRIYPQSIELGSNKKKIKVEDLNKEEKGLVKKVKDLMTLDKLYHEPSFSRSDLARELNVSENILSKIINVAFGQSVPNLLNSYRIEDAKRMLNDKDIPVKVVAFEVGFNSLASFNRVFKEITGESPSFYRNDK